MDITKRNKIVEWLIFCLLVIFPFGQLFKVGIVSGVDALAGLFLVVYLLYKNKVPSFHQSARNFFLTALFSLLFSIFLFSSFNALYGGLYFLRLVSYYALFVLVSNTKDEFKTKIFNGLLIATVFVAVFGWVQYFFYPDLRALYEWGWDDHLYRLVGTFLDPTFTGIILTFGFLLTIVKLDIHPSGVRPFPPVGWKLLALFLLISVGFTYSRASFLALLSGASVVLFLEKKLNLILVTLLALLIVIFFLPKGVGEGQKLERLTSIYAKLTNYAETVQIFEKSPIFGIGFNNICLAKQVYLGKIDTTSHSCGGSDSSLLLVLATTGIAGFLIFTYFTINFVKNIPRNSFGIVFLGSLTSLFVHSLFSNSLFYPWVLGYLAVLGGIAYRK